MNEIKRTFESKTYQSMNFMFFWCNFKMQGVAKRPHLGDLHLLQRPWFVVPSEKVHSNGNGKWRFG